MEEGKPLGWERGSLNQEDLEKGRREKEEEDWGANCPILSIVIV